MSNARRFLVWGMVCLAFACCATGQDMQLRVDASKADTGFYHSTIEFAADSGRHTLLYPKWMPGEHSPSGPIEGLVGLKLSNQDGEPIEWRRDLDNMFAIHYSAPRGTSRVQAELDFVSTRSAGPPGTYGHTANLAVVTWHPMLLFPKGRPVGQISVSATLVLPEGWQCGGALDVREKNGDALSFDAVSLETLIDSPMLIGRYYRQIALPVSHPGAPRHVLDICAESAWALDVSDDRIKQYGKLVDETLAMFGTWHYDEYHFLVSLTPHFGVSGLEHHASSDNRVPENFLVDDNAHKGDADLLAHELFHSWNGKTLRPRGMMSPDYQTPMEGELLWIYEGLTMYYGDVLAARAGFWSLEDVRERLAGAAAAYQNRTGRQWRPLQDTADAAQVLFGAGQAWKNWRRDVDFYMEGALVWLEADVLIRSLTDNEKSLDDFCRAFFDAGSRGRTLARPYDILDVYAALNRIAPHDWKSFFESRVKRADAPAPLGGIVDGGWKLMFTDKPNKSPGNETPPVLASLPYSIGLSLAGDGRVIDVIPGKPAHVAGIGPGMRIIAVEERRFTPEVLGKAVAQTGTAHRPLSFLVENKDFFKTFAVTCSEGERHPHLERDESKTDYIEKIYAPRIPLRENVRNEKPAGEGQVSP